MSGLILSIAVMIFVCAVSGIVEKIAMNKSPQRSLEEIYLEVIREFKERLPDADCSCISIKGYGGADFYYEQKQDKYELVISDWGRYLSTETFLSDESCKRDMMERVIGCYSFKHRLNKDEKQELLNSFIEH